MKIVSRSRGFGLLEVLLALAILAVVVTCLLAIKNEAVETGYDAGELRRLRFLAGWKMEEALSGVDLGVQGRFDDEDLEGDYSGYRWTLGREPVEVVDERRDPSGGTPATGSATVPAEQIRLTVISPTGREVSLVAFVYEEEERGDGEEAGGE